MYFFKSEIKLQKEGTSTIFKTTTKFQSLLPIIQNTPINTIIRWGKQEVEQTIINKNKNKRDNARESRVVV